MRKVLLVLMALVVIGIASEMFLVEEYIEGEVECPLNEQKLLEVTFTLDKPAFLLISQSLFYPDGVGDAYHPTTGWFCVNGEKLVFSVSNVNSTYMIEMDSGQVIVQSWVRGYTSADGTYKRKVRNPILQVMVFCPSDDEPFVTESPPESPDRLSSHSILSFGPFVHVEGCSAVYDIAGNRVNYEVSSGNVYLNRLSAGTYFATGSNGRTTKIVKLK